tara:strand:+ start:212 stop:490 length:279 start_codon:yes stop_codon:yes gene_type:complete
MKIITDKNNNILFKVSKNISSEDIRIIIQNKIVNNTYEQNKSFINNLEEIEYWSCKFSVDLMKYSENDTIQIFGGNGLIELNIIELDTIKEL